ncbi:MAG: stage IV sporulation protein A [Oscillospiraceae bacterium]|nr:stage IV sporulation protein A [Oscillospiraceae bacterium]
MDSIYQDIAARTGGNVYIGVVGPVRTGKSTLIKRIMEQLVIPGIQDPYRAQRARDELPQSGSGKTIMTSEPKFIPEEAAEISAEENVKLRFRMIDSVGYMIPGAVGAEEEGAPRMVTTPWYDHEIPMTQAAELGTKKVMEQHATIGLVVTTDGTVTDIPREDYVQAEKKAILDMKKTGKPFLIIINSRQPASEAARSLREDLAREYGLEPVVADCQAMGEAQIRELFRQLLYTFPLGQLNVHLPRWLDALEEDHPVKSALYQALLQRAGEIGNLGQAEQTLEQLRQLPEVQDYALRGMDLAEGIVSCTIALPEKLYYDILTAKAGIPIENDAQLLSLLMELAAVKQEYDRISDALSAVKATGYGVVMPSMGEMKLEKPELLRKGSAYGVKLKAGAPSIHMIRVDIDTEIHPMVGDETQSRELVERLGGETPENLWQSNIFGKSVSDLIREGMNAKLIQLPEEVRAKFRGTLSRIVNEGATGLICLIL